ncbi:site-specific integrase [Lactobacillus sp.]|uniref:tyrosine-type recombinase/integrase n=1 Tax=Lactobacillus sp. TaxID=1591 RepID=UPI0019B7722D|nr:site-specific integrase [Lactobacillus sp.]MBD5429678.1 site-specific integrase [Lactobacillus sp.]
MAHVFKRNPKSKTWTVRFTKRVKVWDPDKQEFKSVLTQKQKGGFKTKVEATNYGIELEAAALKGIDVTKNPLFKDYFQYWLINVKIVNLRRNSIRSYNSLYGMIKKHSIIQKHMKDITKREYQQFINSLAQTYAISTVKKINSTIRACVFYAIDDGIISKNFTNQVKLYGNKSKDRVVEYLSLTQLKTFLKACEEDIRPSYTSRYMIITAILTGMRVGEIGALHWDDIDFKSKTISITKSFDLDHREMGPTKNGKSRAIAVSDELLKYLKQLKANNMEFVFGTKRSKYPPKASDANKTIGRILKKYRIENQGVTIHSFRHSHVAFLLSQHIDIYAISKRLGHSNVSITLDRYGYLMDEYKNEEDAKIIKSLNNLK